MYSGLMQKWLAFSTLLGPHAEMIGVGTSTLVVRGIFIIDWRDFVANNESWAPVAAIKKHIRRKLGLKNDILK